jgi:hypothetical protein
MQRNFNYSPILTDATRETFFDYVDALKMPQIDYFAIGVQNKLTQQSISLMSNPEWQKQFSYHHYAANDPLRRASLCTPRNVIPLDEIDHCDNFGKEIMRQRALSGVKNGLILMRRFATYNYIITLGTSFSQFRPSDFVLRYYDPITLVKNDFIRIIEHDIFDFLNPALFKLITRPCSDAK